MRKQLKSRIKNETPPPFTPEEIMSVKNSPAYKEKMERANRALANVILPKRNSL